MLGLSPLRQTPIPRLAGCSFRGGRASHVGFRELGRNLLHQLGPIANSRVEYSPSYFNSSFDLRSRVQVEHLHRSGNVSRNRTAFGLRTTRARAFRWRHPPWGGRLSVVSTHIIRIVDAAAAFPSLCPKRSNQPCRKDTIGYPVSIPEHTQMCSLSVANKRTRIALAGRHSIEERVLPRGLVRKGR